MADIDFSEIVYRRANFNDIDTLVDYRIQFLNEVLRHEKNEETEILRSSLHQYFSETLASDSLIACIAHHEGRPLGTGCMVIWRIPGRYGGLETGRLGYILNMYTIPEARRRGIGSHLLLKLIDEAKSLGLKYLHLHASKDGINIYRKAGFKEPFQPELVLRLQTEKE